MMKRTPTAAISAACLFLSTSAFAQNNVDAIPYALRSGWPLGNVPEIQATAFDPVVTAADDEERDRAGLLPLYARFQSIDVQLVNSGDWTVLANGDAVWRVRIASPGADAVELYAQDYLLPEGATLHLYDESGEQIAGPYTAADRQPDGSFSTEMIHADGAVLEYYEPSAVRGSGHFHFDKVGHAYRMVRSLRADPCQVDVNCSEGDGWQEQRDAVVRIRVVIPQGSGWCSGTLVNNTAQDCKPYILSAMHCAIGSTAANFNQYQFRFRFQRSGCGTGTIPGTSGNQVTGCVKRADSNDGGGNSGSDFLLLEMNSPVPASVGGYYAGWNVSTTATQSGKCIHHPAGDEKKISTFTTPATNSGWGVSSSHWRVTWSATANGHGVTEGGSSGSPLFDPNKRIVGTLTGGGSCCTLNGCGTGTSITAPDYYGKMSYHWTNNPNTATQKLKVWLDPLSTNVTTLDGSYSPCGIIGIEERAERPAPTVYPNPAMDRINVVYPAGVLRADRIEVTDISGRLISVLLPEGIGRTVIDASTWSSGSYFLTLVANGERYGTSKVSIAAY
ncbi:MAG: T9SS type A sorting domain-containing protein [Flavobacteriales bacterium]|nr:T9SS type A sorting domain-containing protein [Flavobacteriales bacterium]